MKMILQFRHMCVMLAAASTGVIAMRRRLGVDPKIIEAMKTRPRGWCVGTGFFLSRKPLRCYKVTRMTVTASFTDGENTYKEHLVQNPLKKDGITHVYPRYRLGEDVKWSFTKKVFGQDQFGDIKMKVSQIQLTFRWKDPNGQQRLFETVTLNWDGTLPVCPEAQQLLRQVHKKSPAGSKRDPQWRSGAPIEVYSNTYERWFPGVIYKLVDSVWVKVQYKIPTGEVQQKKVKRSSSCIRFCEWKHKSRSSSTPNAEKARARRKREELPAPSVQMKKDMMEESWYVGRTFGRYRVAKMRVFVAWNSESGKTYDEEITPKEGYLLGDDYLAQEVNGCRLKCDIKLTVSSIRLTFEHVTKEVRLDWNGPLYKFGNMYDLVSNEELAGFIRHGYRFIVRTHTTNTWASLEFLSNKTWRIVRHLKHHRSYNIDLPREEFTVERMIRPGCRLVNGATCVYRKGGVRQDN